MKIKCPHCDEIFDFSPSVVVPNNATSASIGKTNDSAGSKVNNDDNAKGTFSPIVTPALHIPSNEETDGQAAAPVMVAATSASSNPVDVALASTADNSFAALLSQTNSVDTGDVKAPTVNIAVPTVTDTTSDNDANTNDDANDATAVTGASTAPNTIVHSSGFVLTPDNYYSDAANQIYMSNSLFKAIYGTPTHPLTCQDAALNGPKLESEALLIGGYVDAYFEGPAAFDAFKADHESQLMMKSGKDYLKFVKDADAAIAKVSKSQVFMDYAAKGDHQTIMTGNIAGQDFKIKMDAYHKDDKIVDMKYVKSADLIYNSVKKDSITFIEDYGYNIQGAIYQEIVRQNTGKKLPFYIAYITKEAEPDFDLVEIPQSMLDEALEYVKMKLTTTPYATIKAAPKACGRKKCKWCLSKKQILAPKSYDDFINYCS